MLLLGRLGRVDGLCIFPRLVDDDENTTDGVMKQLGRHSNGYAYMST